MSTQFPGSLDELTNPQAGDSMAVVDHATQHANANDAIEALEAKVGVNGSAVTSSLDYKVTQLQSSKANTSHTHAVADVTGLQDDLDSKAEETHSHIITDVTGLQTTLNNKASLTHTHDVSDVSGLSEAVDDRVSALLQAGSNVTLVYNDAANTLTISASGGGGGGGASALDDLSDVTISSPAEGQFLRRDGTDFKNAGIQASDLPTSIDATKIGAGAVDNAEFAHLNGVTSAIQTQIDGKAASSHTHAISDVTGLQASLDSKSATGHTHTSADVSDFTEAAQDAVGAMADSQSLDYVDGTPSLAVKVQQSITKDSSGLKLSGDSAAPGNSKYYGTNSSGTKGFYSLPSGKSTLVDFGSPASENDTATASVSDTSVTTSSIILCTPFAIATDDHDPDDYAIEGITAYATNIVNGVGYDIIAHAPNGSFGEYRIHSLSL